MLARPRRGSWGDPGRAPNLGFPENDPCTINNGDTHKLLDSWLAGF